MTTLREVVAANGRGRFTRLGGAPTLAPEPDKEQM
jgi:hypothetical protein